MASPEGKQYGLPVGRYVTQKLGGKWTPEKAKFFQAWSQAEGTVASYNPFATTRKGYPGERDFNPVGVKHYPNLQIGMQASLDTIKNGYYDSLVNLIKDPNATAQQMATAVANSPWGTGTGVLRVLGVKQATNYEAVKSTQAFAAKKQVMNQPFIEAAQERNALKMKQFEAQKQTASYMNQMLTPGQAYLRSLSNLGPMSARIAGQAPSFTPVSAPRQPKLEPIPQEVPSATGPTSIDPAGTGPPGKGFKGVFKGKTYVLPSAWQSEAPHPTAGLDWNNGARTADDLFPGPPGTPVGSPENGVIVKHGNADGGQSVYVLSDSGSTYFIGHIENAIPVGTRVKRGTPIAIVSPHHDNPHVHIDKYKGNFLGWKGK